MDDLTPVKGPPTPFEGRSAKVLALVVIALLVALIKPWGSGSGRRPAPGGREPRRATPVARAGESDAHSTRSRTTTTRSSGSTSRSRAGSCGRPAISCRSATRSGSRARRRRRPPRHPAPSPGASASAIRARRPRSSVVGAGRRPAPSRDAGPMPTGAPADGEPIWPATIRITDGNHLGLIGVNMPLGYRVTGIGVFRTTDGADEPLDVITPASDWPSHFTIIALADESRSEAIERWPPGALPPRAEVRAGRHRADDRDRHRPVAAR